MPGIGVYPRIISACNGTYIKYKGRTWCIADHFGGIFSFRNHRDQFRQYDTDLVYHFRAVLEHAEKVDAKLIYLMDFLQIPLSIVFTRFLNLFSKYIPDVSTDRKSATAVFVIRLFVLALALVLTGIGAALSLNMRIVPNPGDGIVQAIADCIHKSVGFTKNCVDMICVALTVIICLISGKLYGIGIGTIIAMIAVGRIIVLFNHFTKEKLVRLTGVEQ